MTAILVSDDTLTVQLSSGHRIAGLLPDQVIPRSAVTTVEVVPERRCRNGVPPRAGKAGPGESLTGCLVSPD